MAKKIDGYIKLAEEHFSEFMILLKASKGTKFDILEEEITGIFFEKLRIIYEFMAEQKGLEIGTVDLDFVKTYSVIYVRSLTYIVETFGKKKEKLREELYKFSRFYHPTSIDFIADEGKISI